MDAAWSPNLTDRELSNLVLSGRTAVTRTRAVAKTLDPDRMVFVTSGDPREQLAQAARDLGFVLDESRVFSRCLECNREVLPMDASEAAGRVPEYVLATQPRFTRCPSCGRIYWPGTHRDRALAFFRNILSQGKDSIERGTP